MINNELLFDKLKEARKLSYSPYSHFSVGAVVLTKNGEFILGANIENAAYSLCLCAERNAIFQAYLKSNKKQDIELIGVFADSDDFVSPSGSCRQVMAELLSLDTKVYLYNSKGEFKVLTVEQLIPFSFSGDFLK